MKRTRKLVLARMIAAAIGASLWAIEARADQVIADDMIVQGSVCIGPGCADGEVFGTDTVRLKNDNLRIHFDDTSTTGGFAANDWRILINGEAGGDPSFFAIEDSTANLIPFVITAGAPPKSFFMGSSGQIGLRTEPSRDLHIFATDAPTIRFEQNDGETLPQVWDLGGYEFEFFISDETAATQPFRIRAGAPTNSFVMKNSGRVGFGTENPGGAIEVASEAINGAEVIAKFGTADDVNGKLFIVNGSAGNGTFIPKIQGRSAGQNAALVNEALVTIDTGASPAIAYNAAKVAGGPLANRPLVVYRNNNVAKATITANGAINATSFNPTSSRETKDNIVDLDPAAALDALRTLNPVTYVYKEDESKEPRVGFIAEDVPDLVANADRKSVPIMDVLALVTRVVKDQQQTIESQNSLLGEQKTLLEEQRRSLDEQKRFSDEQKRVNEQQKQILDELARRLNAIEGK